MRKKHQRFVGRICYILYFICVISFLVFFVEKIWPLSSKSVKTVFSVMSGKRANVTLSWDANPEPDLMGYKSFIGEKTRVYALPGDNIPKNSTTITYLNLPLDTFYFAVTAYDSSGNMSLYSEEVSIDLTELVKLPPDTTAPGPPGGVRIEPVVIIGILTIGVVLIIFIVVRRKNA